MPSTTIYEPGDVLVVEYRHTDGTRGGRRPVVVLSTREYNARAPDVIIAQITSQMHQLRLKGSVKLRDWKQANLRHESIVKTVISSYPETDIVKRLGSLSERDLNSVRTGIATVLGFRLAATPKP